MEQEPQKRKRGRPKKNLNESDQAKETKSTEAKPKRKVGRPRLTPNGYKADKKAVEEKYKKPRGRPRIKVKWSEEDKLRHKYNLQRIEREIDMEQVLYWMDLQATCEEIAGAFHVSRHKLVERIKEEFGMNFDQLRDSVTNNGGRSKCSLRRYQFDLAKKNASMAIWLGKNWLGQKDTEDKKDQLPPHLAKLIEFCCNEADTHEKAPESDEHRS